MCTRSFVLFAAPLLLLSVTARAQTTVTASAGIKSENLRPGGGKVVSENPVLVTTGQITNGSGTYLRFFSTAGMNSEDFELDIGPGISKTCFKHLKCRGEVTYWVLPKNDAVDAAVEISGTQRLGKRDSLDFSARFEELAFFGLPDTQIFRLNGTYTHSAGSVPIRFSAEVAYNRSKDWLHAPLGLSAKFSPRWFPKGVSTIPSLELIVPLSHRSERKTGVAFGITLSWHR